MLNRFNVLSAYVNPNHVISTIEGIAGLGVIGISHQMQQIRTKSKIKFCGYLEPPEFKKRDIRYKTSTKHDPKRMTWQDYQFRRFRAVHWGKSYPLWQAKLDYAENLCRLGMPVWTVERITGLHPHCIEYINKKLNGQVVLLREAEYSNYVNHKTGER
ncbi:hypothetical protein RDWZM_008803 [Blomia tropicalis]|uniref:Uncharacterized protein n=1 Tax=Blomia tropicalis TaxID=40697 RepID=A0A9Q0RLS1_BLOTA|nr:hypothetical protein RDWZM_008803 [Blomia tropicalis]